MWRDYSEIFLPIFLNPTEFRIIMIADFIFNASQTSKFLLSKQIRRCLNTSFILFNRLIDMSSFKQHVTLFVKLYSFLLYLFCTFVLTMSILRVKDLLRFEVIFNIFGRLRRRCIDWFFTWGIEFIKCWILCILLLFKPFLRIIKHW